MIYVTIVGYNKHNDDSIETMYIEYRTLHEKRREEKRREEIRLHIYIEAVASSAS
jgi:hypothetical protein